MAPQDCLGKSCGIHFFLSLLCCEKNKRCVMTRTPELHLKSEKGVNISFYIHLSSPKSYTVKLVFKALPCRFSKMEQVIIQTTAVP